MFYFSFGGAILLVLLICGCIGVQIKKYIDNRKKAAIGPEDEDKPADGTFDPSGSMEL